MNATPATATDTAARYRAAFDARREALAGAGTDWLAELRLAGLDKFAAAGFPTVRWEEWKYTNLAPLAQTEFAPANDVQAGAGEGLLADAIRLHLVNGRLAGMSGADTLPAGVRLTTLRAALSEDPELLHGRLGDLVPLDDAPLAALNTAFMEDGLVLLIDDGVTLETPIELVIEGAGDAEPVAGYPRHLIALGEGARATVLEHARGQGAYFTNQLAEVILAKGARLGHYIVQEDSAEAWRYGRVQAYVAAEATYDSFILSLGGKLSRNELKVKLDGAGAHTRLLGAYMQRGRQHCDTTTVIDHATADATSEEIYKGVLDERARAVFQGKIIVRQDSQRTDGHQLSQALLLSDDAEIDTKPELEIYADDVKCSHGATAGELDEEALFYLRSRGIPEAEARSVLIRAFVDGVIEEIEDETIAEVLRSRAGSWRIAGAEKPEAA
jgi:Fe-S cluster assembly protein SufD